MHNLEVNIGWFMDLEDSWNLAALYRRIIYTQISIMLVWHFKMQDSVRIFPDMRSLDIFF